jgi:YVTN family beta-propeller protein
MVKVEEVGQSILHPSMPDPLRRPSWRAGILAIAIVVVLIASVPATALPGSAHIHPRSETTMTPASAPLSSALPIGQVHPSSAPVGGVLRTLVLYNQTIFAGNFAADYTNAPQHLAYDPANGTAWVTSGNTVDVANTTTNLGIRLLPAGFEGAIAFDNRTDTMWVTDSDWQNLTVFNATTYAREASVGTGYDPEAILFDWKTNEMFVANSDPASDNVTVIDASDYSAVASVPVGSSPDGLAWDPSTGKIFVANEVSTNLTVFGQSALTVHSSISIGTGSEPSNELYDPANGMLYVTGAFTGIGIVNPGIPYIVGNITPPGFSTLDGLALNSSDTRLYVSETGPGVITYFVPPTTTTTTALGQVGVGLYSQPEGLAYDSRDARLLVGEYDGFNGASANMTEISGSSNQIVGSVGLQRIPDDATVSLRHHAIYVYDGGNGRLYELNDATDQVNRSVFVGYTDQATTTESGYLAYDMVNDTIYVDFFDSYRDAGGVAIVNATTFDVMQYLNPADFDVPAGIAYDPTDHQVFVANLGDNTVTAIFTASLEAPVSIGVGDRPRDVAFDPSDDGVFVTNEYADTVSVITGASDAVKATAGVGLGPVGVIYDPDTNLVYVANSGGSNLTALSSTTDSSKYNISLLGPGEPYLLTYDPVNETVEAMNAPGGYLTNGVTVVNETNESFAGTVYLGAVDPGGIVYDDSVHETFAVATDPGSVFEIGLGTVSTPPPPIRAALAAVPATIAEGHPTTVETTASGGVGPLTYTYSTLPSPCTSENTSSLPCTPAFTGSYFIGVNVTDFKGDHGSATTRLTVTATPLTVTLAAVPSTVQVHQATSLEATAEGGTGPITYVYTALPAGCTTANVSTLPCTPTAGGEYFVVVSVTDVVADHASASAELTVTTPTSTLTASLAAKPGSVPVNHSTTLTVTTSGLPSTVLTYVYGSLPPGCVSANSSTLNCVPTEAGTYHPQVEVHDDAGHFANASTTLSVTAIVGGGSPSSDLWIGIVVAVLIGAVIILFVAVLRRRRRNPPEATSATEAAAPVPAPVAPPPAPPPPP